MDIICQMCSRPLKSKDEFGTSADGSPNPAYGIECFKDGKFSPEMAAMSVEEMMAHVKGNLKGMNVPEADADKAVAVIPNLLYWRWRAQA